MRFSHHLVGAARFRCGEGVEVHAMAGGTGHAAGCERDEMAIDPHLHISVPGVRTYLILSAGSHFRFQCLPGLYTVTMGLRAGRRGTQACTFMPKAISSGSPARHISYLDGSIAIRTASVSAPRAGAECGRRRTSARPRAGVRLRPRCGRRAPSPGGSSRSP